MTKLKIKNDWDLMLEVKNAYHPFQSNIDQGLASKLHCPRCGQDMNYRGYSRIGRSRREYAFAICIPCKIAFSF